MDNALIIKRLTAMLKDKRIPHKYRVALSWCVAKLSKEEEKEDEK